MNKKLSYQMQYALNKMESNKWYCAYDLQVSLRTLNALIDRDLVMRRTRIGYTWFPHNNIFFMKKDKNEN